MRDAKNTEDARPAVVDVLVDVGLIRHDDTPVVSSLAGGYWNEVVRIDFVDGRRWVVKRFASVSDNPYFPVEPDAEDAAIRFLAGAEITADPITYLPEHRLLVTEFLPGPPWQGDLVEAARLLRRVHSHHPQGLFRQLPVGTDELMTHAELILDWGGTDLDLPRPTPGVAGVRDALVHTDCGPGNMISTPQGLRLIDWQCPGIGDPVEDLACFTSPAIQILYLRRPLRSAEVATMLTAYDEPQTIDRFHQLRHAHHWRMAAYCAARAKRLAHSDPAVAERYRLALTAESELIESLW
jgi:thiamine kinase